MLTEHIFMLADNTNSSNDFFHLLNQRFNNIKPIWAADDFINSIEAVLAGSQHIDSLLFVFFVQYDFLVQVEGYLNKRLNTSSYILVSFGCGNRFSLSEFKFLFEYVNTALQDFDYAFFFNKLDTEIFNRSRLSLLQYEIREFYEIGKSLSSEKDTIKLLEMIINSSMSMTCSDAGTIYLVIDKESGNWSSIRDFRSDDRLLKFAIARNMSISTKLEASTFPITRGSIVGYSVISGRPLRIDDAYTLSKDLDYKHNQSFDQRTGYITKSILSIPMKDHKNNVMGLIQLINKKKTKNKIIDYGNPDALNSIIPYDYSDELIMESLAGQAAVALENNLLYRDMENLLLSYKEQNTELEVLSRNILKAHEEERKRIAREIHDGPAQSVVNLSLKLELCKKYLQISNFDKLSSELVELSSNVRATAREIRTIIYDLKPSYLEDGLAAALENRFNIFSENTGINISFTKSGDDSGIEYYLASTIYRIVQEALSNISKHAGATNVKVDFNVTHKGIILSIVDNGKGFDINGLTRKKPSLEGGFGLGGIKERVELIKGNMTIKSSPGKGTSITVAIPMQVSK